MDEAARERARRLLAGTPLAFLGLAFCRSWSQWAIVLLGSDAGVDGVAGHPLYDIGCLAGAVLVAASARRLGEPYLRRGLLRAATAAMCLAPLAALALRPAGVPAVGAACSLAGGAAFLAMSVSWACFYASFSPMRAMALFCLERLASEAVSFVMGGLTRPYLIGAVALIPLFSYWCLRRSVALAGMSGDAADAPGFARPLPWKPALLMFSYALAYAAAEAGMGGHLSYPASLAALVPPAAFVAFVALYPRGFKVGTLYLVACPAMIAAVLLPAALPDAAPQLVRAFMELGYSTAVITEFLIVAELSQRLRIQSAWLFAFVRAFRYGGLLAGSLLATAASRLPDGGLAAALLIVTGVAASSLMLVSERGESPSWGMSRPGGPGALEGEALDGRTAEVGELFGLSSRETQVLGCLMRHMTVADVSRELVLAEGTVKAHIQHIYQKTGCHSRKELEAVVNGRPGS